MTAPDSQLSELNARSLEVFHRLVDAYLASGEPVGSRTLTRSMKEQVSAATIRNVMQDLEYLGLLTAPHISAGRIPTDLGLRLFVDGLLEVGDIPEAERSSIERSIQGDQNDMGALLDQAGQMLSGLTQTASIVLAPKSEAPVKHIEFVSLAPGRALAVLVYSDGQVENRLFTPPLGLTPSAMQEAANFLNAVFQGQAMGDIQSKLESEIMARQQELDTLAQSLITAGLAAWSDKDVDLEPRLIVKGRAHLIEDAKTQEDLDRVKVLFDDLERKRDVAQVLDLTQEGDGVKVFIGSENKLFSLTGSSLVVSPYMNADQKVIGAVGVIGPTRLNYGRVVPIVDYTAHLVGRMLSERG
ncbi:MAG: heat-inducible transcriptional repressor HrcA [Pseudomonadota bacterium]